MGIYCVERPPGRPSWESKPLALIDIWDEGLSEQRIAERVIARVHGATVRLKLKER